MPLDKHAENHVTEVANIANALQRKVRQGSNDTSDGDALIAAAIINHAMTNETDATALREEIRELRSGIISAIANR